jgi:hypothetical protein
MSASEYILKKENGLLDFKNLKNENVSSLYRESGFPSLRKCDGRG